MNHRNLKLKQNKLTYMHTHRQRDRKKTLRIEDDDKVVVIVVDDEDEDPGNPKILQTRTLLIRNSTKISLCSLLSLYIYINGKWNMGI